MDCSQNTTFGVKACMGQLVNFCNPNTITYSGCINGATIDGTMVDVAGIEREVAINTYDRIALVTYVDPNNNNTLYYNEWDRDAPSILGESTMDANGNGLEYPRIDAVDPRTENTSNGDALYTVAYRYFNNGNSSWEIKQMNNVNFGTGDVITSYYNPTDITHNYSPVVADFGTKWNFDVAYATSHFAGPNSSYVFSEEVAKGGSNPGDILLTPATPDIYVVNTTANATGTCDPVAISSAWTYTGAVQVPGNEFVCWINAGTSSSYVINCKACAGVVGYKPTGVEEVAMPDWTVSPNPTQGMLAIGEVQSENTAFMITDVLGRVQMKGAVPQSRLIDVSQLSKGIYILSVLNPDKVKRQSTFVKE